MKNETNTLYNFSELPDTSNPKTVVIYRKTKAGNWEKLQSHWYRQGYKSTNVAYNCMVLKYDELVKSDCNYKVAYKAKTVKGKQIYSTEYDDFIANLCYDTCEGIMVDKTKFIPKDRVIPWLRELSANHDGIKNWKKSASCKADNYLIWGYLICNDGHREKVAFIGIHGSTINGFHS